MTTVSLLSNIRIQWTWRGLVCVFWMHWELFCTSYDINLFWCSENESLCPLHFVNVTMKTQHIMNAHTHVFSQQPADMRPKFTLKHTCFRRVNWGFLTSQMLYFALLILKIYICLRDKEMFSFLSMLIIDKHLMLMCYSMLKQTQTVLRWYGMTAF